MKYNNSCKIFGFSPIYNSGHFHATTIIAIRENQKITVSDILKFIGYATDFIKVHFDVENKKYSQVLLFLKTVNLFYNNQSVKSPSTECLHFTLDVFHEILDMIYPNLKKENAKIAITLNLMIDVTEQSLNRRGEV